MQLKTAFVWNLFPPVRSYLSLLVKILILKSLESIGSPIVTVSKSLLYKALSVIIKRRLSVRGNT